MCLPLGRITGCFTLSDRSACLRQLRTCRLRVHPWTDLACWLNCVTSQFLLRKRIPVLLLPLQIILTHLERLSTARHEWLIFWPQPNLQLTLGTLHLVLCLRVSLSSWMYFEQSATACRARYQSEKCSILSSRVAFLWSTKDDALAMDFLTSGSSFFMLVRHHSAIHFLSSITSLVPESNTSLGAHRSSFHVTLHLLCSV